MTRLVSLPLEKPCQGLLQQASLPPWLLRLHASPLRAPPSGTCQGLPQQGPVPLWLLWLPDGPRRAPTGRHDASP